MTVRAAGGVPVRKGNNGLEVLVVHRPRYDDWSFPKGKCEAAEGAETCALREVREETGLVCELGDELPSTWYLDGKGRLKLVRYWAMRVVGIEPWAPNDEIDQRRWVTLDEAAELLTYAHDRDLLDRLRDQLG